MIDLKHLRENPDSYKNACKVKRIDFDVDYFLDLDEKRRQQVLAFETIRSKQNEISKEIPKLNGQEKSDKLALLKSLSEEVKVENEKLKKIEEEWKKKQLLIPSIPLENVPVGKNDSENVEIKKWGEVPSFDFKIKDHIELGKELGIIDVEQGVKVAGARSYYLKGFGARLQHALLSYAMDFIQERGYELFDVPHIVLYSSMANTGYFPGGEDMAFHLGERDADSYLIGTSEVPLVSYYSEKVFADSELPIRSTGFSPCYRREAGSYGKDTHGLYRVHQFYKVEQVIICKADKKESEKMHNELLKNSEDFMQSLNIPYRVVEVCTGDMGQGQVFKHDIESWMPSRNSYGETHSCSTLHDFQARRSKIQYKDNRGKKEFCHTLNNTLIASPRVLIPVLELNQQKDGSVLIPKVLRKYCNNIERIKAN